MNLPAAFEEKMRALLGDEFDEYIACYEEPRYYGMRVNTGKISVEEFEKICRGQSVSCKASVLFCRPLLSSGAECYDTGEPSSGRAGR